MGKTRLALAVAQAIAGRYAHGVAFVGLASVRDPALVMPVIAEALGLSDQSGRPALAHLQEVLRERELLLVLDNFEHVASAAVELAALLAAAPRLTVLVTSRALLREELHPAPGENCCCIYHKLQVQRRTAAVARARELGLL